MAHPPFATVEFEIERNVTLLFSVDSSFGVLALCF
jgi:hypothetical protein